MTTSEAAAIITACVDEDFTNGIATAEIRLPLWAHEYTAVRRAIHVLGTETAIASYNAKQTELTQ